LIKTGRSAERREDCSPSRHARTGVSMVVWKDYV